MREGRYCHIKMFIVMAESKTGYIEVSEELP